MIYYIINGKGLKMAISKLKLYNELEIQFTHPDRFHLPRFLAEYGLANYEPVSQASFIAAAKIAGGCIYDIGANIGIYSLAVVTLLKAPVYAYEPFHEAATVLETIAADYSLPIKVYNYAVGEHVGSTDFYISTKSDMSNSLNPTFRSHREIRNINVTTIDVQSELIKTRIGAIKIDTETSEYEVLLGGKLAINRDRPVILLEVLTSDIESKIRSFFKDIDYKIVEMGDPAYQQLIGNVSDLDKSGDERNWLLLPNHINVNDDFMNSVRLYVDVIRRASWK